MDPTAPRSVDGAFRHGAEAVAGDKFGYGPILRTRVFLFGRRTWERFSILWPGRATRSRRRSTRQTRQ